MIDRSKYGQGSVYSYQYTSKTRTTKKWRYQLWVLADPSDPESELERVSGSGFTTKSAALKAMSQKRKEIEAGLKARAKEKTIGKYAWEWFESLRLAPSTLAGYKKIIRNHIEPELGEIPLSSLTPTRLNKHYKDLLTSGRKDGENIGKPLSSNSVNKVHSVLAAILDSALHDGYVTKNVAKLPAINVPKTKAINAEKDEITPWTASELKHFLEWDKYTFEDPLYTLWYVYAMTGARHSEALALRWSDFSSEHHTLAIRRAADPATPGAIKKTKSGSSRVIHLSQEDVDVIKAWKKVRRQMSFEFITADALIFGNDSGELRSPNEIGRRWRFRVAKAHKVIPGLRIIKLHDLRHTHATLLLQAGIQPKVVQERLGHSTIAITMNTYSHVMPTMQQAAADTLRALMQ